MATSDLLSNAAQTTTVDGNSLVPVASAAGQPTKNAKINTISSAVASWIASSASYANTDALIQALKKLPGIISYIENTTFLVSSSTASTASDEGASDEPGIMDEAGIGEEPGIIEETKVIDDTSNTDENGD